MNRERGQVVLILILVMTVALAIGISVVQRSLSDISTSTKVEQSQRAFSAAEAGIEKALNTEGTSISAVDFTAENQSTAVVTKTELLPAVKTDNTRQAPLEFPPLSKEQNVHIWLADPLANLPTCSAADVCYKQTTLDVYWGSKDSTDVPAIELTLIYYDRATSTYQSRKWYLDYESAERNPVNNFDKVPCGGYGLYKCKITLGSGTGKNEPLPSSTNNALLMLTARLLYNSENQPLAVQAVGSCTVQKECSIPPQARIFISTGTAGAAQRRIKLFQFEKVTPPYFDYGLFSAGEIIK